MHIATILTSYDWQHLIPYYCRDEGMDPNVSMLNGRSCRSLILYCLSTIKKTKPHHLVSRPHGQPFGIDVARRHLLLVLPVLPALPALDLEGGAAPEQRSPILRKKTGVGWIHIVF